VQRGTAVVPTVSAVQAGFPNVVQGIGGKPHPMTTNLDLGIYYPIKLGEKRELRLTGDWFNVFNSHERSPWIRPSQLTVELEVVRVLFRRYQIPSGVRHC